LSKKFVIFGDPVAHLKSPQMQNAGFKHINFDAIYEKFHLVDGNSLNNEVIAYNTDAPGFLKAIQSFGKINKVLILGAGGTAKAISLALQEENVDVTVLNRSKSKLDFFKNHGIKSFSFDDFVNEKFDLVVNSTSAGLKDEELPAPKELLENVLKSSSFAFDCIYGRITPFLVLAKSFHNEIKDGEDMLLYQGVLAFEYFTNTKADNMVIEAMRKGLK